MYSTCLVTQSKVRTTAYHEYGGGNAANTATTMALLSRASVFKEHINVKLCTKIGDDHIGRQLIKELELAGVDLSSPLFQVSEVGTTTGLTNVIVSEAEQTRTCLHTPGTCGEITPDDVEGVNLDEVFGGVIHFHTDGRHADAALILAREAKRRGVPVSIDVEKDRNSKALDYLLEVADIVFTNSDQIECYLNRLTREYEEESALIRLKEPNIVAQNSCVLCDTYMDLYAHVIKPSAYVTRRFGQQGKLVVITKGDQGALSILTAAITERKSQGDEAVISNQLEITHDDSDSVRVHHNFTDRSRLSSDAVKHSVVYDIHKAGVLTTVKVVDTTGAGDAFIGGYILSRFVTGYKDSMQSCLEFGCWVSGRKLQGFGARSALPTAAEVDEILGVNPIDVQTSLRKLLSPFRGNAQPQSFPLVASWESIQQN
jgi:sugar/nucleoside kinase (ribokinase family)